MFESPEDRQKGTAAATTHLSEPQRDNDLVSAASHDDAAGVFHRCALSPLGEENFCQLLEVRFALLNSTDVTTNSGRPTALLL